MPVWLIVLNINVIPHLDTSLLFTFKVTFQQKTNHLYAYIIYLKQN